MISSLSNPKVKYVRRLQADRRFRHRQQAFVVEGTRWLKELLAHPQLLRQIFYREEWAANPANARMLAQFDIGGQSVSEEVLAVMSATETAPGILAVIAIEPIPIPLKPTLIIVLDAISDPGNLGTILRTSAATGVDVALLGPRCVDPYNPKVIRSAMGAHLRLPVHQVDWAHISKLLHGLQVWFAAGDGPLKYTAVDWRAPSAIIVGNEAHGAGEQAQIVAKDSIAIPMQPGTESLNVAIAASVIMFEVVRQRGLVNNA